MNAKLRSAVAVTLLGMATPAYALTISGPAIFEVLDADFSVVATGSWVLERSRVLDFEFTTAEDTWDEFDIPGCDCQAIFPDIIDSINFRFSDAVGNMWGLFFSFHDGNFGIIYDVNGVSFSGTSADGEFFALGDFDVFVEVPEPGTLSLLGLGLLGLGLTRRRAN